MRSEGARVKAVGGAKPTFGPVGAQEAPIGAHPGSRANAHHSTWSTAQLGAQDALLGAATDSPHYSVTPHALPRRRHAGRQRHTIYRARDHTACRDFVAPFLVCPFPGRAKTAGWRGKAGQAPGLWFPQCLARPCERLNWRSGSGGRAGLAPLVGGSPRLRSSVGERRCSVLRDVQKHQNHHHRHHQTSPSPS